MKKNFSLIVTKLSSERNNINVLKPITFKVLEGQLLIIRGDNGKGKTTLLHCLAGIISYNGKVEWRIKKKNIGYVGHKVGLKEYETVEEFIIFWKEIYDCKLLFKDIVELFSLSKLLYFPIGFLSFGQKKKLSFVRLFILGSKAWLLDEPFSGMDSSNRKQIAGMIEKHISNNGTVILSTHESGEILNIKNKQELLIV